MELAITNRRTQGTDIVPYKPHAPHVMQALQVLGDEKEFFNIYVPANLHTICDRQLNAMRVGKSRQVSLILSAYGTAPVLRCLRLHFIWLKMLNLYSWSETEIDNLAMAILRTVEARLLDWISLLGFFRDIADGRITLYGGSHRDVMQAFQNYFKTARNNDIRLRAILEDEKRKAEAPHERVKKEVIEEIIKKANILI